MSDVQLNKEQHHIAELFDGVANHYDLINNLGSLYQAKLWRIATRQTVNAQPGQKILDVASGNGASAYHFVRDGAAVTACDISEGMLDLGRRQHPEVNFVYGNAMDLPFDDNTFDTVTISYGLRNVEDPEKALREFHRVAKVGGRLVLVEFSRPVFPPFRFVYEFYLRHFLPRIARLVGNGMQDYVYLAESILQWPEQKRMGHIIERNGWSHVEYKNLTNGIVAIHHAVKVA